MIEVFICPHCGIGLNMFSECDRATHIQKCTHANAERAKVKKLRAALVGLVGMEAPELLEGMKQSIVSMSDEQCPPANKKATIVAIDALLETQPAKEPEAEQFPTNIMVKSQHLASCPASLGWPVCTCSMRN